MAKSFKRNRKAVSPVIATIIIVAVAIVMSIAVAYWMLGLAGTFTRFEKLEFTSAYATAGNNNFTIHFSVKNTGTATATITKIFINGIPLEDIDAFNETACSDYGAKLYAGNNEYNYSNVASLSVPVNVGVSLDFNLTLAEDHPIDSGIVTSGITIEIMIQTAAGNQYPKSVTLP